MEKNEQNTTSKNISERIFTKKNAKRAIASIAILAAVGGIGSYWHHQRAIAMHCECDLAETQMVASQAEQSSITIISEDEAKAAAAQAIGLTESDLTFDNVSLKKDLFSATPHHREHRHNEFNEHEPHGDFNGYGQRNHPHHNGMAPDGFRSGQGPHHDGMAPDDFRPGQGPHHDDMPGINDKGFNGHDEHHMQPVQDPKGSSGKDTTFPENDAHHAHNLHPVYRVLCSKGNVHYAVLVDAVSSNIISSRVLR